MNESLTNKAIARLLRKAASAFEHGRYSTGHKAMADAILSADARDALVFTIDLALDDQENYLQYADFSADYGDEWNATAKWKARCFANLSCLLFLLGERHLSNRCDILSETLRSTVSE